MWPFDKSRSRDRVHAQKDHSSLGNLLLHSGLISEENLTNALKFQDDNPDVMLGEALVQMGLLDREAVESMLVMQQARRQAGKKGAAEVVRYATDNTRSLAEFHHEVRSAALRLNGKAAKAR